MAFSIQPKTHHRGTKTRRFSPLSARPIGVVVIELRIGKRWSQGKLAAKAGYSTSWVNMLEKGKVNPTLELVIAFADTFHLTLSQFFARAERRVKKQTRKSRTTG